MRTGTSLAAFCLIVVLAACAFTASAAKPDADGPGAPRWEHLALTHDGADVGNHRELSNRIVRLGEEGWELVSVSTVTRDGTTAKTVFYFKRPR